MNIEGTYTLQATPEDVWRCLSDPQLLKEAIPGIGQLEKLGPHTYALSLHLTQAPLMGNYHGQVSITDMQVPYHCRIQIENDGQQSTLNGGGVLHLNERGNTTVIAYKGNLHVTRLNTLPSPALTRGAAMLIIQQFFSSVADKLRSSTSYTLSAEEQQEIRTSEQQGDTIVILSPTPLAQDPLAETPTLLRRLIQFFHIGEGDPKQEAAWEHRVRRVGIVSGLLFLFWVGTRLPRR